MRYSVTVLCLTLVFLALSGCSATPTEPPEATNDVALSPLSTPEPVDAASPVPVEPTEIDVPPPDVGVVTGALLSGNPSQPHDRAILYLGRVVVSGGQPAVAAVDKNVAPKTLTDVAGRFVFSDVPPGQYAMVLDLVTSTVILRHPSEGGDLLIDVSGGEITDLGDLAYPDLPSLP